MPDKAKTLLFSVLLLPATVDLPLYFQTSVIT